MRAAHWLMTSEEVIGKLGITRKRLEKLQPYLVSIATPGRTRRFPRAYINALTDFLDGRDAMPTLVRSYAQKPGAAVIGAHAKLAWYRYIHRYTLQGYLTTEAIMKILNVSKEPIDTWVRIGKLTPHIIIGQSKPRWRGYNVQEFVEVCSWQGPGVT